MHAERHREITVLLHDSHLVHQGTAQLPGCRARIHPFDRLAESPVLRAVDETPTATMRASKGEVA
jgi:hypothetical protein